MSFILSTGGVLPQFLPGGGGGGGLYGQGATPPHPPRWLLPRPVPILVECILVYIIKFTLLLAKKG